VTASILHSKTPARPRSRGSAQNMAAAQTTTARSQSDARGDGFRTVSPPAESVPHPGLGRDVQPRQHHPVGAPGRGRADLGGGRPKASLPRAVPPVNGSWTDTGQQWHQDQHEDHGHDRDLREEQAPQPGTAQLRRVGAGGGEGSRACAPPRRFRSVSRPDSSATQRFGSRASSRNLATVDAEGTSRMLLEAATANATAAATTSPRGTRRV
jgi:hypothetical protein